MTAAKTIKTHHGYALSEVKGGAMNFKKNVSLSKIVIGAFWGLGRVLGGFMHVLFVPSPEQERIEEIRVKYRQMGPHF